VRVPAAAIEARRSSANPLIGQVPATGSGRPRNRRPSACKARSVLRRRAVARRSGRCSSCPASARRAFSRFSLCGPRRVVFWRKRDKNLPCPLSDFADRALRLESALQTPLLHWIRPPAVPVLPDGAGLLAVRLGSAHSPLDSSGPSYVDGMLPALWIGASVVLAGAVAAFAIGKRRMRSAEEVVEAADALLEAA
jgi:hypothetical protein